MESINTLIGQVARTEFYWPDLFHPTRYTWTYVPRTDDEIRAVRQQLIELDVFPKLRRKIDQVITRQFVGVREYLVLKWDDTCHVPEIKSCFQEWETHVQRFKKHSTRKPHGDWNQSLYHVFINDRKWISRNKITRLFQLGNISEQLGLLSQLQKREPELIYFDTLIRFEHWDVLKELLDSYPGKTLAKVPTKIIEQLREHQAMIRG